MITKKYRKEESNLIDVLKEYNVVVHRPDDVIPQVGEPLGLERLVFTLENPKQHNLTKLLNSVKKYSNEFIKVFPQDTPEEKRLFELIKAAYVNGRYDPDFVVTKEDIDALVPKVELLRDITKRICEEKIGEYGERE
ncbi:HEPN domain-containing protein [Dysgonomonas sp. HDW5A]|uniref:HEPN domain-containing protein n=1 Tax=Dysgonomonas sp. HDW5A TaxID=2714926 RepID=UPI002107DEC2|nr:HEPN domain-containing protein [Dysgonomonas sp. HDW5A]